MHLSNSHAFNSSRVLNRSRGEEAFTDKPNLVLDLALLPTRSRIAELRLEDIVIGHGKKPGVDLPLFTSAAAQSTAIFILS